MTREEQIAAAFDGYSDARKLCTFDDFEYADIQVAFEEGAKWADNHSKSPWLKYKDKKPEVGVEVIAFNPKWIDEDFNPNGTRIGFLSDDGFTSAFWWDYQDCYETISKIHCESNKDFYRSHIDNTEPEFWMPIPESPKE